MPACRSWGLGVLLGGIGDCRGRHKVCPLERRELNDRGVELVYLWLWIHERRLHGGIEQLLSLLAVTGKESALRESCVRWAVGTVFELVDNSRAGGFEGTGLVSTSVRWNTSAACLYVI